jgi:ABC-type glycerol-3-phosphate transport system permease component
VRPSPPSRP